MAISEPARIDPFFESDTAAVSGPRAYLALGDSYTIGTAVEEKDRYAVQAAALLKTQGVDITGPKVIAANGWTTTDLLNRLNSHPPARDYDLVTLLIGVNNQYQGGSMEVYKTEFATLLNKSIQFARGNARHVIVLSIPDYSVTPFAKGSNITQIAETIDAFNAANQAIAANLQVQYLNITEDSRKAAHDLSLLASDGLHFSGKEYAIWAARLAPMLKSACR